MFIKQEELNHGMLHIQFGEQLPLFDPNNFIHDDMTFFPIDLTGRSLSTEYRISTNSEGREILNIYNPDQNRWMELLRLVRAE